MKENWIYKEVTIRMSEKTMANFLYATIMTKATITSTYCLCYGYNRKQNSTNGADLMIHIDPNKITQFEELSGVTLKDSIKVHIN